MKLKISLTIDSPNGNPHPTAVYNVLQEAIEQFRQTSRSVRLRDQKEFTFATQYQDKCHIKVDISAPTEPVPSISQP